jgi:hypothetical protein
VFYSAGRQGATDTSTSTQPVCRQSSADESSSAPEFRTEVEHIFDVGT